MDEIDGINESRLIDSLALCPCGERPKELGVVDNGQGSKWGQRTALAVKAWNETNRG